MLARCAHCISFCTKWVWDLGSHKRPETPSGLGYALYEALWEGELIGTFTSQDENEYQYEFSVLDMRIRFGDRHFSKCAYSEQKSCTRSRPRPPI